MDGMKRPHNTIGITRWGDLQDVLYTEARHAGWQCFRLASPLGVSRTRCNLTNSLSRLVVISTNLEGHVLRD